MEEKVSIIVPVYNCEKYIYDSIKSILNQKYKNIELIIVNDGSTDGSFDICNKIADEDNRVKLFNNINHGVSYSRNFGIDKSSGKYLSFIDADDIVSNDFISTLVYNIEKYDSDCSIVGITNLNNISKFDENHSEIMVLNSNLKKQLFTSYGGFLANKLYRSDIIKRNKMRLDEDISISEDLIFNIRYLEKCIKVVYDSSYKYFYRIHSNSSFFNYNNNKWFSIFDTYLKIIENPNLIKGIENEVYFNFLMSILEGHYRAKKINNRKKLREMNQYKKKYFKKKYNFSVKQNIKIVLFYNFPKIVMLYKRRNVSD